MKRIIFFLLIGLQLLNIGIAEEELDKLPLVALLLKNGHLERAERVYGTLTEEEKKAEAVKFSVVSGLLSLAKSDFAKARESFLEARAQGHQDPELAISIAQASYGLKDYENVVEELEAQKMIFQERPRVSILYLESLWKLKRYDSAFTELKGLMTKNPELSLFKVSFVQFMLDLGLLQSSLEWIMQPEHATTWDTKDIMILASLFHAQKSDDHLVQLLQYGALLFPENTDLKFQLAAHYAKKGQFLAAASVLDQFEQKFAIELSELYRQSGFFTRADYLATLARDSKERTRQKLTLYLSEAQYDKAVTLEDSLTGQGLLSSDQLRYALAYAFYRVRDFDKSEFHLSRVQDGQIYSKALQLRSSVEKCRENIWSCD